MILLFQSFEMIETAGKTPYGSVFIFTNQKLKLRLRNLTYAVTHFCAEVNYSIISIEFSSNLDESFSSNKLMVYC